MCPLLLRLLQKGSKKGGKQKSKVDDNDNNADIPDSADVDAVEDNKTPAAPISADNISRGRPAAPSPVPVPVAMAVDHAAERATLVKETATHLENLTIPDRLRTFFEFWHGRESRYLISDFIKGGDARRDAWYNLKLINAFSIDDLQKPIPITALEKSLNPIQFINVARCDRRYIATNKARNVPVGVIFDQLRAESRPGAMMSMLAFVDYVR